MTDTSKEAAAKWALDLRCRAFAHKTDIDIAQHIEALSTELEAVRLWKDLNAFNTATAEDRAEAIMRMHFDGANISEHNRDGYKRILVEQLAAFKTDVDAELEDTKAQLADLTTDHNILQNLANEHAAQLATARDAALEEAAVMLWLALMEWCKKHGYSPATHDDLFALVAKTRALKSSPAVRVWDKARVLKLIDWLGNDGHWLMLAGDTDEQLLAVYEAEEKSHD